MTAAPDLFNPSRSGHRELDATFVGRWPILHKLELDLLADAAGTTSRHWLLIGPRGTGKTHLTALLGRRLQEAHGWDVVRLPEEQHQVASLAGLLEQIVLGLAAPGVASPFAAETDSDVVEERALVFLRQRAKSSGARPVLVILENLDRVLERKLSSNREQTRFRQLLMRNAPFHVVATSPGYFDAVAKEAAPFYDFFQTITLDDLTAADAVELIEKRARCDGEQLVLARMDDVRARMEALFHLTGGNPRFVTALYSIFREGPSEAVDAQLMKLLDEVTPYFQARLGQVTPQMARVLTQLALADGPRTPADVARACRLPISQTTANIAKLAQERFVKPGGRPDRRRRYYEVTDRLFRIWIQMREDRGARRSLPFLTEFYQRWYAGSVADVWDGPVRVADSEHADTVRADARSGSEAAAAHCVSTAIPVLQRGSAAAWEMLLSEAQRVPAALVEREFVQQIPALARKSQDVAAAVEVYRRFRDVGALAQEIEPYATALRVRDAKSGGGTELDAVHPEVREAVSLLAGQGFSLGRDSPNTRP